jgi:hypothetical protein
MTRPIRRSQERGQTMAELAVCSVVFVALLTFGIHFGELQWVSQKVHEAQEHATWDSTAYRVFDFNTNTYNSAPVAAYVATHTQSLYQNYVGLSWETFLPQPQLVDTAASAPMTMTCQRDPSMTFAAVLPSIGEPNGIWCSAQGQTSPIGFAAGSLQEGGGAALLPTTTSLCGVGKATAGSCANNHSSILLGDFGLAAPPGGAENQECVLQTSSPNFGCANTGFYKFAYGMWSTAPSMGWTGYPENWANNVDVPSWFGLDIPGGEITGFYMSFRGENSNFTETVPNGSTWQTSPMDVPPPGQVLPVYRYAFTANAGTITTPGWPAAPTARKNCQNMYGYCFLGRYPEN